MVELALILPVLLLLLLVAIDFGRVYLGWINVQQMTRVAANFAAEHASAWATPQDAAVLARYQDMVENDAEAINCILDRNDDGDLPGPAFIDLNYALGSRVEVRIGCEFQILTPIISTILGSTIPVDASIVYPIREGAVAAVPGGGGPVFAAPVADFLATPRSGYEPLAVTITDLSQNPVNNWSWNFGNGGSSLQGPHDRTYECDDTVLPGDFCTFTVSLTVGGEGGFDSETKSDYITVYVPPLTGPIAEFEGTPLSLLEGEEVDFDFVDLRALEGNPVVYTDFRWDFDGDGTVDANGPTETSPSFTYDQEGVYDVTLTVSDGTTTHTLTKQAYVVVTHPICTVPDFARVRANLAQARWEDNGFSTDVIFLPGPNNYRINYQSLLGGLVDPQPDGCDSVITVGP